MLILVANMENVSKSINLVTVLLSFKGVLYLNSISLLGHYSQARCQLPCVAVLKTLLSTTIVYKHVLLGTPALQSKHNLL